MHERKKKRAKRERTLSRTLPRSPKECLPLSPWHSAAMLHGGQDLTRIPWRRSQCDWPRGVGGCWNSHTGKTAATLTPEQMLGNIRVCRTIRKSSQLLSHTPQTVTPMLRDADTVTSERASQKVPPEKKQKTKQKDCCNSYIHQKRCLNTSEKALTHTVTPNSGGCPVTPEKEEKNWKLNRT